MPREKTPLTQADGSPLTAWACKCRRVQVFPGTTVDHCMKCGTETEYPVVSAALFLEQFGLKQKSLKQEKRDGK